MVPVTALSQNAAHIYGNTRTNGFIGTAGQKPRIMKLSIELPPATIPIPMVCRTSMVGKAQIVGAFFTHWLKERFSRNSRKCMYDSLALLFEALPARRTSIQ